MWTATESDINTSPSSTAQLNFSAFQDIQQQNPQRSDRFTWPFTSPIPHNEDLPPLYPEREFYGMGSASAKRL